MERPTPVLSSELVGGVQALEHTEEAVRILHVETGAIVPHRALQSTLTFHAADFGMRACFFLRVNFRVRSTAGW